MFKEAYEDLKSGLRPGSKSYSIEVARFGDQCKYFGSCTGNAKEVLVNFSKMASSRFDFLNENNRIKARHPYIWIIRNHQTCSIKAKYNHIVIDFSILERIVSKSYEVGLNKLFFRELTDDLTTIPGPVDFESRQLILFEDILKYSFSDPLRQSIVYFLIYNSFLFIIDHEICHLSFHRRDVSFMNMEINRLSRAKEFDADLYAVNRCIDNMQEKDIFMIYNSHLLEVENNLAKLGKILKPHRVILCFYSMFLSFLCLGNLDWWTDFDKIRTHPSIPFRFKCNIAAIIDRDDLGILEYSGIEYKLSEMIAHMAEEFFMKFHKVSSDGNGGKLISQLDTNEADNLFYQIYKDWCCLRSYGAIISF